MIRREEIFAFVAEHGSELFLPDQDVLNALYGSEVLALDDAIWNYDARNYRNYLLRSGGVRDMKWVMQQTSILHFCGRAKPWKHGYKYRFGLLYQHYVQLTKRFLRIIKNASLFDENSLEKWQDSSFLPKNKAFLFF